jgi:predicted membrane protein
LATLVLGTCLALGAAHVLLRVPKPMLAIAAGLFLACCVIFQLSHRYLHGSRTFKIAALYLVWVGVAAMIFWVGFQVDRSRWVYYQLTGYDITRSEEKSHLADASVRAFLAYNRAFVADSSVPGGLFLPPGEHVIDHTVVVPRETQLTIAPGATLLFGDGCSLVSYSPIVACGTTSAPILFTARDSRRKWGSVGIVGGGLSLFEHVRVEHGRHARVNGTDFFGTLSLIGADVHIRHSQFVHLHGKDAVYVRGGSVAIHDNLFQDTYKDGLDLDGGSGTVSGNRFVDCRDEGIDVSQAGNVTIVDNVILDPRGGRIGSDSTQKNLGARNTLGFSDRR